MNNKEQYVIICNKCCLIELIPIIKNMNINVIETRDVKYNNILILILATNFEINELATNGYFFHAKEQEIIKTNILSKIMENIECNICKIL